jgi:hypothetical protein
MSTEREFPTELSENFKAFLAALNINKFLPQNESKNEFLVFLR